MYNYLLHEINDKSLSIKKLAEYLDEMGKKTAEIFSILQLGTFIPT